MHPRQSLALKSFGNQSYIILSVLWSILSDLWPQGSSRDLPLTGYLYIKDRSPLLLSLTLDLSSGWHGHGRDALNIYNLIGWSHPGLLFVPGSHKSHLLWVHLSTCSPSVPPSSSDSHDLSVLTCAPLKCHTDTCLGARLFSDSSMAPEI